MYIFTCICMPHNGKKYLKGGKISMENFKLKENFMYIKLHLMRIKIVYRISHFVTGFVHRCKYHHLSKSSEITCWPLFAYWEESAPTDGIILTAVQWDIV